MMELNLGKKTYCLYSVNEIIPCLNLLMVIALNAGLFILNLKEIKQPQVLNIKSLGFFMGNRN